ncbi:MAG: hypothetical protein PHW07_03505 [Sulfurospirillaceae bacterium]|nr:hypothetical protein [Sulfurospirillaceae bacterium]
MMKILVSVLVLFSAVFSADFVYPDFSQCYEKNKKSIVRFGDINAVAIRKDIAVAYCPTKPSIPYIAHDPFLNLYFFKSEAELTPVKQKSVTLLKLGEWIASMSADSLHVASFSKTTANVNDFYNFDAKAPASSIVGGLCCEMYGLGVENNRFVSSDYIDKILSIKEPYSANFGVKFSQNGNNVLVSDSALGSKGVLKVGDKIISINGKKIESLGDVSEIVLPSKNDAKFAIEALRRDKVIKTDLSANVYKSVKVSQKKRTFFEDRGLYLDASLKISKIANGSFGQKAGLKIGDKLLSINQLAMKSSKDVENYFAKSKTKESDLLFDRDDFQFFVKIEK